MTFSNFKLTLCALLCALFSIPVSAVDLGEAAPYNAFVFESFSAPSSDVEGRLAAGGNVSINNYSVGDKLDPNTISDVLVSGGDIIFPSGRVYYGNIIAAGSVDGVGSAVINGMQNGSTVQGNTAIPVDFNQAYNELSNLSATLSNLPTNTTFESQWGGLYLHGDCSSDQQVFNLEGATVLNAHTFQVDCIPNDAYVIFNISGANVGLSNMSMNSLAPHRQRVIYNFYEAQNLTLSGIGVEGTILAVDADIDNPQGVIKGQLIVNSWNGMMQLNHEPFINNESQSGNQPPFAENQRFEIEPEQQLNFTLQATDTNGDELVYTLLTQPTHGLLTGNAPNLTYIPNDNFNGIDTLTYTASDSEFTTELITVTFSIGLNYCTIFPYALEHQQIINLQEGEQVNNYSTSVGQGNYSLLTWNGNNDTNTLADSFTMPGNSENYINPEDNSDTTIDIGDWIQGVPGKKNASKVRDALDLLIDNEITVPLWSQTRKEGSNFDYKVGGFANIILTDYKLNGQSNISFEYLGLERCLNYAPVSYSNEFTTAKNSAKNIALTDENSINNTVQNLLAVFDANDDELTYIITNPPTNGILSGIGPDFTYIPNNDFVGSDEFSFKVNDGYVDSNESIISITVEDSNTAPVVDDLNIITLEDQAVSIELTATDADNDSLSYQVVTQPSNGSLSGTAPNLVYAPNADFNGSDSFTFNANDGTEDSSLATVSINITPVNDAPIGSALNITTDEDNSINITLVATDIDNDTLTFTITTQPTNGSLSGVAPALVYTPNPNYNGVDSFSYSVNDGSVDSTIANGSILINAVNDVPVADNQNISTTENVSVNILLSGSDIDGDLLTYNIINPPQNGSISGASPNLIYTPNTDYSGVDSFTFVSNDGQSQSNQSTISITITENPNNAPVAEDQSITTLEDQDISITLTATDADNDVLSYQLVTQPLNGSLSGIAPNLVYTPNTDFNGIDSFSHLVNDGTVDSNTATVIITINAVNDAPKVNDATVTTDEDSSVNITLSGTDVDNDVLTYTIINQPTNGSLVGDAPNLTYQPNTGYSGNDSFTFVANDGLLDSNQSNINITINLLNQAPIIVSTPDLHVNEYNSYLYKVIATDINNDVLSYDSFSSNAVNIDSVTGMLTAQFDNDLTQSLRIQNNLCKKQANNISFLNMQEKALWPIDTLEPRKSVDTAPIVVRTIDSNNDGVIDQNDVPVILFVVYGGSNSELIAVRADTNELVFRTALNLLYRASPLAAADLDLDGIVEIIGINSDRNGIIVFENDGTIKYEAPIDTILIGEGYSFPITIADLEGDGIPEILVAGSVLSSTGDSLWALPDATGVWGAPIVADINDDGVNEVITGGIVYNALTGAKIWESPVAINGRFFTALANLDEDTDAELIFVVSGDVYAYEHSGEEIWSSALVGGGYGGAPTVGQVDGSLVIGIAGGRQYNAFNAYGDLIWTQAIADRSSSTTGSTMFDFNGDGRVEIAYADERHFRIYDAATGTILSQIENRSHTSIEYPVVADVDNNGSANIIVVQNGSSVGVRLFSGEIPWVDTRSIWNQYAYNVNNINDDGSVPANPVKSWQTHNTYRLNTFPNKHTLGQVDLALYDLRLNEDNGANISVLVNNRGLAPTELETIVGIYNGNPSQGGSLLGNLLVPPIMSGEQFTLTLDNLDSSLINNNIFAIIDENNTIDECINDNNSTTSALIQVEVSDPEGLFDTQRFTVSVENINESPSILTNTFESAINHEIYIANVIATDPDLGDSLLYEIINAPNGMFINEITGEITWVPSPNQIGSHTIHLQVTDLTGATANQDVMISVYENSVNQTPFIVSSPETTARLSTLYQYQLQAIDFDGDNIKYELIESPTPAMKIDDLGLLTWYPSIAFNNQTFTVTVKATDTNNAADLQTFEITVGTSQQNNSPLISSVPKFSIQKDYIYQYQIVANDIDGDILEYALVDAPTSMSIDSVTGMVSWIPDTPGIYPIAVSVTDHLATVSQEWLIEITEFSSSLDAQILISPKVALPNQEINIYITPNGFVNNLLTTATLDGVPIVLDNNLHAVVTIRELGVHSLNVSLQDDNGSAIVNELIYISDIIDLNVPTIDIITPTDGGTATGMIDIFASIQDENLSQWKLSYRSAEDGENAPRTEIASGTTNVENQSIAQFDTSLLHNGIYVLVLEAVDVFGNYTNIAHSVFIEGDLKIGHFKIAFEDLNIPVAGIPVTISRSYDTRDRNSDRAFGKGWSIGYQALELTESRIPGLGWYMSTEYYNIGPVRLPRYCIESIGDRLVSVRMPDGDLEKFKVKAKTLNTASDGRINCQDITPPDLFYVEFVPQGDTNSTLTSNDYAGGLRVTNGNLQVVGGFEPINPNKYTLTLLDGTIYQIDQGFNLTEVETTDGNSIRFTHDGIEHSSGFAVQFVRDSQDRIISIVKPNGDSIEYTYNAQGDLESHTDLLGNTTQFTYILDHYLEDIIDPRGITVARNEFDTEGRLVAHIDANGNRIEYTHDIAGRTETIKDRNGNSSTFVYDNAGSVIAETNALGETTYHEYNDIRLETKRTDPLGNETTWTYDNVGNQLTETDALGNTTTSTYNFKGEILAQTDAQGNAVITNVYSDPTNPFAGGGNLSTVTDALGNTTQFHWTAGVDADLNSVVVNTGFSDALGNRYDVSPISGGTNNGLSGSTTDLNGLTTETTYDDEARPLTTTQIITDDMGTVIAQYTTTMVYNENGDVIQTTDALGNSTFTEYNELNKVSATIDANGARTEYEFDARGNPSKTIYPDGTFETTGYDLEGNVMSSTDREGRTTITEYDAANRVVKVTAPDGSFTTNDYDVGGRLVSVTDALGNVTSYGYDELGRRTSTTDSLNHTTTFVYDDLGRRTQSTDALGRVTDFEYNDLGNMTKTTFANGKFTSTTYDELSRKVSETDLAGRTTTYEYSDAGNLSAVIDALGQRTEYDYDQRGNKIAQTDANGNTTVWSYDALGRVDSRILPMGEVETYGYDSRGNMTSKTDFNGDTTIYEYNNLNQRIKTTYADNTTVENTYTITGQVETVTESNGTTTYGYDIQNRLKRIDYPTGNYIEYGYDLNGNRTRLETSNQVIDYGFDALNRLETVTNQDGTTTYTYDAVGNRATQINANGTVATYTYDDLNRLLDLTHTDSSNTIIASYQYTLGDNGNRLSLTELSGRIVDYTYDDLYRLLSETITDPINGNHYNEFAYDPVGNRLQQYKDGVTTSYTYNDNDHLLTETEGGIITSYVYDDNGNTLTKSIDGLLDTDYSYSKDNRLNEVTTPTSTMTYTYDAGGIRQSQTVDGTTTHFLVDPNRSYAQVLEEQSDLFIPQTIYLYGDDLITQSNAQGVHTFGYDGLGSTRILTDASGVVQNAYGYEAFGEVDYQLGTVENKYLFTGEQYDNNVGFYYLRARFYNPSNGRFSQMDIFPGMMHEPKSLHKYLYTHADPINNIDPSGNISIIQAMTTINVAGNLQTYGSITINIFTGNYAVAAGQIAEEVVFAKLGALGRPLSKLSQKAANLFYNILGRNIRLIKTGIHSSTDLGLNLIQVGVRRPAHTAAHHLISGNNIKTAEAFDILKRYDIDVNSPNNGVFLARNRESTAIGALHSGGHTNDYFREVNERIVRAGATGDKIEVLNELGRIKIDLLTEVLTVQNAVR